ncbi:MAG: alpha/beta hydrolase [Cyclobacteriaceae bacterium]
MLNLLLPGIKGNLLPHYNSLIVCASTGLHILFLSLIFLPDNALSFTNPAYKDVPYATIDGKELKLDIYLPSGVAAPVLLVWIHGGAWRSGSKENVPPFFVNNGFAVASLDFRQSTDARFPAAVHDIKAAIRFLRAKESEYGYKTDRLGIAGSSSGGHLATLVGVSNGHNTLEGTVGDFLTYSSDVHAIVDFFGASNLTTILAQSTPHGLSVRKPALELLLGGLPDQVTELSELASPVFHVDKNDPPILILHGDQDPQMPINQSHELEGAYQKFNLDVQFEVAHGAAHGGELFFSGENAKLVINFLRRILIVRK